jgi:hypothetical protein
MIASSNFVARSGGQIFVPASQTAAARAGRSPRFVAIRFEFASKMSPPDQAIVEVSVTVRWACGIDLKNDRW